MISAPIDDRPACPANSDSPISRASKLTPLTTASLDSLFLQSDVDTCEKIDPRLVYASATLAALSFLLLQICDMNFCDPDLWHEMSLFRQTLIEGRVPTEDRFAYTATVSPSIHHEWGSGAIFYLVATTCGAPGIMVLKYGLVASVLAACYLCAKMRGAGTALFLCASPSMALFSSYGFTTIRAQVFTLVLLAIMLCFLELDQRGHRWWIALWLPLHLVWLNLHAGFVVGSGLMALHACEQMVRGRPFLHFLGVGAAMAALTFVNPYGVDYLPYLLHGLTMARPLIVEWNPLWEHDTQIFALFLLSLVPVVISARRIGWKRLSGIVVLAATAYAAARHTRHLSLYCVVWTCYVPGFLRQAGVGTLIEDVFRRYGRLVSYVAVAVCVCCLSRALPAAPWKMTLPATNAEAQQGLVCYPVEAVEFLDDMDFHGNLMLPFEVGGYAMWKLHPKVRVSLDGRYEVAYQPGVLEEHLRLFRAQAGWKEVLGKYPTDALLVPSLCPLAQEMDEFDDWKLVYSDNVYRVYTPRELVFASSPRRYEANVRFP